MKPLLVLLLLLCCYSFANGDTYRWHDAEGHLVFGDKPPEGSNAEKVELTPLKKGGVNLGSTPVNTSSTPPPATTKTDHHCRSDVSKLNKITAFLRHTPNPLDRQKAKNLRLFIIQQCGRQALTRRYKDHYCDDYRREVAKIRIYLKQAPNDKDEQRLEDLQYQIKQEC